MSVCLPANEWVSVSEWACVCQWMSECLWVNERVFLSEWVSVWLNERVFVSEWVSVCEWTSVFRSEWVSVCEWTSLCFSVNEWVSERMSVCLSVNEWVSVMHKIAAYWSYFLLSVVLQSNLAVHLSSLQSDRHIWGQSANTHHTPHPFSRFSSLMWPKISPWSYSQTSVFRLDSAGRDKFTP